MAPSASLHPFASPAKDDFVTIVRGEGAAVYDDQGTRYVDAMASLWYCNVGHGRSEVVDAVAAQMRTLEAYNCFDPYTNPAVEDLSATIADLAPMDDPRIFLVTSGSEAVDSAIKLARQAHVLAGRPERTLVVSRDTAYHGVTFGGLSAQGLPANQEGFGPMLPGFVNLAQHDLEAVATLLSERGDEVAAVLTEPVQGAGGVHPPEPGYLEGLRKLCDQHGAYLIFDEVICGFGRLGRWWGAEHFGVRPDLITFAKGVTSGYLPLGGVVVSRAICDVLEADADYVLRHGHTYSGHPTVCVAGSKCIEITEREGLVDRATAVGKRLSDGLGSFVADGLAAELRGEGAVWALGLDDRNDAVAARDRLLELGVIVRAIGPATLAFCPPLVSEAADIDHCVDAVNETLR